MQPFEFKHTIESNEAGVLRDVLAARTGLPKNRIKSAMTCGAVWHQKPRGKWRRVRRATTTVRCRDRIAIYYDESILNLRPAPGRCIRDQRRYSIWFKPAGLMTQGGLFGDHCALSRQVERHFHPPRKVFIVHRLDRETKGLVIFAHDREAAAQFNELFKIRAIKKRYQAVVKGKPSCHDDRGFIDTALDNRSALTKYRVLQYDASHDQSYLEIEIVSGRHHQIRRHFESIGHPVMGDPVYGRGNKNDQGLQLTAYRLTFTCPFGKELIEVEIDPAG